MDILKCVVIEDQLPAQRILEGYIEEVPNLELAAAFISPLEALPFLEEHSIDVLFLDIHLPKISGIDFLKLLHQPPLIILTTAFTEYAVEGFELDVVDYLLKPFSFERFLKSISKIQRISKNNKPIIHRQYLFVRAKHIIEKIEISQILYIEANGDFVLLYTPEGRHIANISLQEILGRIGSQFVRCHKSYIVNISSIERINGNRIFANQKEVPIGRTYKDELMKRIEMI